MDLSALGLSNVQPPHGGKRDKAGASQENDKESKNFGDLVNEAGKKTGKKQEADDDASAGTAIDDPTDEWADIDIDALAAIGDEDGAELSKLAKPAKPADLEDGKNPLAALFDSEEATGDEQKTGGRVRLSAAFQQLIKSTTAGDKAADGGAVTDAVDVKPEVKSGKLGMTKTAETVGNSGKAENADGGKLNSHDLMKPKEEDEVSPSRELHALLGLAPKKDDAEDDVVDEPAAKVQKYDDGGDPAVIAKPAHAAVTAGAEAKTDAAAPQVVAQQQIATQQQATMHAASRASSEKPAQADAGNVPNPVGNDADVVHLVSNDGKGRQVDIELAKVAGGDSAEPATSGKVDFVTVLDSRRYLGFSNDAGASNASALTNAIKAEPSWAQVIHGVNTGANRTATEVNTLKLQMNPEHLGNMTASLRLKGDELSVEVRVDTVDAYRQLSSDHDSIVKALKDQGFSIDQVTIQLSPSARADGGQNGTGQQSNGSQQGNDQNLQQGGQGDNARQRDESARRNANQNNWTGNDKTSSFNDSGSSADDADSGNLYL